MLVRFSVLLFLFICHPEEVEAFPELGGIAGFIVNNGGTVLNIPGYLAIFTSKSNFLTYVLHKIFGDHFENQFKTIIKIAAEQMPDSAPISDVKKDNDEDVTFRNGEIKGLKSIQVTPGTDVKIIWPSKGMPFAVVSVQFTALEVEGDIKTDFYLKAVDGRSEIKFFEYSFTVKFRLYPGLFERCYLEMFDVAITDNADALWAVRDDDGGSDMVAGMAMRTYFSNTEGAVENHIKTTIANVVYHEIPKASPAICDNSNKNLMHSKYETFVKKKESTNLGDSDASKDNTQVQRQESEEGVTNIPID